MEKKKLTELYQSIHEKSIRNVKESEYFIDDYLDSKTDTRRGLTLLTRLSSFAQENVKQVISELRTIEPDQYYYPNSDIHITVLSIISCYTDFQLHHINQADYIGVIKKSLTGISPFTITLKGLCLSDSGLLVRGYPKNDSLERLRNSLRKNVGQSDLEQSIDSRYTIKTAHATIMRFKNELQQPDQFLRFVEKQTDTNFGKMKVDKLELVFNDWYQTRKHTQQVATFDL